ncbi:FAD-dependent oxidoreductase [Schlesneria paludicola]|uniref:FAD-dependent oxidoreductase n=1 Tax=Schlesneria paludicola TaxID=360056 RepID=UPI000299D33B|nr:FAD-dependent oxidoreductase [Schlesneria paludicola]
MRLDALIFGGGAAGLWLLDRLSRDGHHVLLLEAHALGAGQTIASQGIIHSGMKYTLTGLLTQSAKTVREMSLVWRDSLLGRSTPNLSHTQLRSGFCLQWHADTLVARAGAMGPRYAMLPKPETVSMHERPAVLSGVFGVVARTPEQVIAPRSFIQDLANQYRDRILKIDAKAGMEFELESPGEVAAVRLTSPADQSTLELKPRQVIFTAGAGNSQLRKHAGLSADLMPRRPLRMVLVRGDLPELNGHCLDGTKPRVTITSEKDQQGRMVWQVGGEFAEESIRIDEKTLTERARSELSIALPGVGLRHAEWSTYAVDHAEGAMASGAGLESIQVLCAGNVTTGWPTKLALAPILAQEIASRARAPYVMTAFDTTPFVHWPRPSVAQLPWDEAGRRWWQVAESTGFELRRAA